jgi:hypothetical protein
MDYKLVMKKIIDVINKAISQPGVKCLPCDRVNLDFIDHNEYLDSDEHKATELFEFPKKNEKRIIINKIDLSVPSILKYFLDGSRRTYKIADLLVNGRYLPLIAGQVGVSILERDTSNNKLKPFRELCCFECVITFPDELTNPSDIIALEKTIKEETGLSFTTLRYSVKKEKDPIDLGIAEIMKHMQDLEVKAVNELTGRSLLNSNALLVKDGSLRYKKIKGREFDITQFRNVVGLSKTFKPSFTIGSGKAKADVGAITSSLEMMERTPVYKSLEDERIIGMWYLRLRPKILMNNPLQGIVKIEMYAINRDEEEKGLETDIVNTISQHIVRERNVTPYGSDKRWATHIYPVYMAEKFIKSSMLSDLHFEALF